MDSWLNGINCKELQFIATPLSILDSGSEEDSEMAASFLYKDGRSRPMMSANKNKKMIGFIKKELDGRPPKSYWEHVKKEIYQLVCSSDKKYEALRKQLKAAKEKGTKSIVIIIASYFGAQLGVEAGAIAGFCAIAINSIVKLGKETYCSINKGIYL